MTEEGSRGLDFREPLIPTAFTHREELRACRQRVGLLTDQQDSVAARVATEREATNT